jgi:DNA primase
MIDRLILPSISEILRRLDIPPGRRGRTICPIHRGDNPQAFSYSDDKGQWFCFRCGVGGDAIRLIELALDIDFNRALTWLGIQPGIPQKPDPAVIRRQKIRQGLQNWTRFLERKLRDEFYIRSNNEYHGKRRLRSNPEDRIGWEMLSIAYKGIPLNELESWLDLLIGTEAQLIQAYKMMRAA